MAASFRVSLTALMPKPDHRSQMARAWLHFHAARKGRGSGSAAPRVDWPAYPRRAEHTTVAEGGNRRWAETARQNAFQSRWPRADQRTSGAKASAEIGGARPSYRGHAPSIAIRRITSLCFSPGPHGERSRSARNVIQITEAAAQPLYSLASVGNTCHCQSSDKNHDPRLDFFRIRPDPIGSFPRPQRRA
jgi:hypothetical protein